jgi:hypothetical protein
VPVSKANKLLGASYQLYNHARTNETILRTVGYALPAALHIHVKTIAPTTAFASTWNLQQMPHSCSGGAAAEVASGEPRDLLSRQVGYVRPLFLRSLYTTITYTPVATDRNLLAIVGFNNKYPSQEDLTLFLAQYRTDARASTFTSVPVNGRVSGPTGPSTSGSSTSGSSTSGSSTSGSSTSGSSMSGPSTSEPDIKASMEANLDIQYSAAIVYPTPVIYYAIGSSKQIGPNNEPAPGDSFLEWFNWFRLATGKANTQRMLPGRSCWIWTMLTPTSERCCIGAADHLSSLIATVCLSCHVSCYLTGRLSTESYPRTDPRIGGYIRWVEWSLVFWFIPTPFLRLEYESFRPSEFVSPLVIRCSRVLAALVTPSGIPWFHNDVTHFVVVDPLSRNVTYLLGVLLWLG